jgi:dextranase
LASGGSRIELGERGRLLADPYFPKHQEVSTDLATGLRRYWDVAVRYGELLFDSPAEIADIPIEAPKDIWTTLRSIPGLLLVSLVNMRGLPEARGAQKHSAPQTLEGVEMRVGTNQSIARVWWIDADSASAQPWAVEWRQVNGHIVLRIPKLSYWGLVLCELAEAPA